MTNENAAADLGADAFIQDGLENYAPALVALSEFRRQVGSKLQGVLDEFSIQFEELGFDVSDLKLARPLIDGNNLDEKSSDITLKRVSGSGIESAYYVEWNLNLAVDEQVWVGIWLWLRKAADRELLFRTLGKFHKSTSDLEQSSIGTCFLTAYVDTNRFHNLDREFRLLVEEWINLLTEINRATRLLVTPAAATSSQLVNNEDTSLAKQG